MPQPRFGRQRHHVPLAFEPLEKRQMLAGCPLGEPMDQILPLIYEPGGVDDLISIPFTGPSGEDTSLKITVIITGAFDTMATIGGSFQINTTPNPDQVDPNSIELENGATASLTVSARSLEEIFAADPNGGLLGMTHDRILGSYVVIHRTLNDLTLPLGKCSRVDSYAMFRFISAVEPGTDKIHFEMTREGEQHRKQIDVWTSSRQPIILDNPSNGSFTVPNSHFIQFTPQAGGYLGSEEGTVDVIGGYDVPGFVGTLQLSADSISLRKWWIDENAFAHELQNRFPNGSQFGLSVFEAQVDQIVSKVESYWGRDAIRVENPAEAHIRIEPRRLDALGVLPRGVAFADVPLLSTPLMLTECDLVRFSKTVDQVNAPTAHHRLNEVIRSFVKKTVRKSRPILIGVDLTNHLNTYFVDAANPRRSRDEIAKTIAHEMGHAHGFVDHIRPGTSDASQQSPFDVMQKGGYGSQWTTSSFQFNQSAHFLRLLLGTGWGNVAPDDAIKMMTTGEDGRRHGPFFCALDELKNIRPKIAAMVGRFGSTSVFPGSFGDNDFDGAVTLVDLAMAQQQLGTNSPEAAAASQIVEVAAASPAKEQRLNPQAVDRLVTRSGRSTARIDARVRRVRRETHSPTNEVVHETNSEPETHPLRRIRAHRLGTAARLDTASLKCSYTDIPLQITPK